MPVECWQNWVAVLSGDKRDGFWEMGNSPILSSSIGTANIRMGSSRDSLTF